MIEYARKTEAEGLVLGTRTCHFLITSFLRVNNVPQALTVLDKIEKEHYRVSSGHTPLVRLSNDLTDALRDHFPTPPAPVAPVPVPVPVPVMEIDGGSNGDKTGVLVSNSTCSDTDTVTDTLTDGSIDGHSDVLTDTHSVLHTDTLPDIKVNTQTDTQTKIGADTPLGLDTFTHTVTDIDAKAHTEINTKTEADVNIDTGAALITDIETDIDTDTDIDTPVAEELGPLSPLRSPSFNIALLHPSSRMIIPDIYFGAELMSFILLVTSNQLHVRPRMMGTPLHAVSPV